LGEGNSDGCGFVHWSGCGAGSLSRLCLSYQIGGGIAPPLVDSAQTVTMASTLRLLAPWAGNAITNSRSDC
jgi:hypothetical protein